MQSRVSAVITFLKDGTIVDTDSNSVALFGYTPNELMGLPILLLLPDPYDQIFNTLVTLMTSPNIPSNWNLSRAAEAKRKDGSVFPAQFSFTTITEDIFMLTIDSIAQVKASLSVSKEGKIVFAQNEHEIFGYSSSEILNQHYDFVLCGNEKGESIPLNSIIEMGDREREVTGRDKSGTLHPLILRLSEVINLGTTTLYQMSIEKVNYENEAFLHYISAIYGGERSALVGQKISSFLFGNSDAVNTKDTGDGNRPSKKRRSSFSPFKFLEFSKGWEEGTMYQYLSTLKRKDGAYVGVMLRVFVVMHEGKKLFGVRLGRLFGPLKYLTPEKEKTVGNWKISASSLGEGAFGKVKQAENVETKMQAAIKVVNTKSMNPSDLVAAKREIEILRKIEHKNIVKLLDVVESHNKLYIVLEYAGHDLYSYVLKKGKLTESEAREIFIQVCDAVEYCHSINIVHRDIKPNNILLDENKIARLIDFGVSNFSAEDEMRGTYCGTTACAPPEMILGKKYQGTKVDVWSLGVLLYFMLTGNMPFPDIASILDAKFTDPKVSSECIKLLHTTLDRNVETRAKLSEVINHVWLYRKFHIGILSDSSSSLDGIKNLKTADNSFTILSRNELGSSNELNFLNINISSSSTSNNSNQDIQIPEDLYKKTLKRTWQESETDESGETCTPASKDP